MIRKNINSWAQAPAPLSRRGTCPQISDSEGTTKIYKGILKIRPYVTMDH